MHSGLTRQILPLWRDERDCDDHDHGDRDGEDRARDDGDIDRDRDDRDRNDRDRDDHPGVGGGIRLSVSLFGICGVSFRYAPLSGIYMYIYIYI